MHSAPAVNFPVGRSRFQGWMLGTTLLGGAALGLLWHQQADLAAWRQCLFAMSWLCTCVLAIETWRRAPTGRLRWDGQGWSWISADAVVYGGVTVHLDLQFFLLVCLQADTGTRFWLWPERRAEVARWNDLRRAVFSLQSSGQHQVAAVDADVLEVKS